MEYLSSLKDWILELFNNRVFLIVFGAAIAGGVAWAREEFIYRRRRKHDFLICLDELVARLEAASDDDLFNKTDKLIPTWIYAYKNQLEHIAELSAVLPQYLTKIKVDKKYRAKVTRLARDSAGIALRSLEHLEDANTYLRKAREEKKRPDKEQNSGMVKHYIKIGNKASKRFKEENQDSLKQNLINMREIKNEFRSRTSRRFKVVKFINRKLEQAKRFKKSFLNRLLV